MEGARAPRSAGLVKGESWISKPLAVPRERQAETRAQGAAGRALTPESKVYSAHDCLVFSV